MRFVAVLNRNGGTLRTMDVEAFSARMREILGLAGHSVETRIVAGDEIVDALDEAAAMDSVDVVLVGGGDGTVSAAAGRLMNGAKALAVLPAGTMNLFARSLAIPQTLEGALAAFADGEIRPVDIASANGRPFVHQFSIGMHAKMIHLRSKMEFGSRLGKMRASMAAAWRTVRNPPAMDVELTIGDAEILARTSGVGVTNNLLGEGHLPYADRPDGGVLGIYVTMASESHELFHFFLNMARGRWRDNEQVEIHQAEKVKLAIRTRKARLMAAIDGELCRLEHETNIEIHPKSLLVLTPRQDVPMPTR